MAVLQAGLSIGPIEHRNVAGFRIAKRRGTANRQSAVAVQFPANEFGQLRKSRFHPSESFPKRPSGAPLICGMGEPGHLMLPDGVNVNNSSQADEESWGAARFLPIV